VTYPNEKYVEKFQSLMHSNRGQASVVSGILGLPLTQVIYACFYLRGLPTILSDIFPQAAERDTSGIDFYWEFTDEHKSVLSTFYLESGFKRNDICTFFNIARGSATSFFSRQLGTLRKQGNAYMTDDHKIIRHKLAFDMRIAFTDLIDRLSLLETAAERASNATHASDVVVTPDAPAVPKQKSWYSRFLEVIHVR